MMKESSFAVYHCEKQNVRQDQRNSLLSRLHDVFQGEHAKGKTIDRDRRQSRPILLIPR